MSKSTITIGKDDAGHAVKLDVDRLIASRVLVTATSGGGKSWLLRKILEEVSATTQTLVIDPEGEFSSLREIRDMVLVGADGDIPADPRSAGLLARRLMETNVSAVIDIYELTPTKRREFVAAFCGELINLPKSLWRPCFIAIDEAHEFAPNSKDKDYVSGEAVGLLFSKGRKRGFCPIVATQRISKLSADVAAEAKNRFIGQTSYDVDQKRVADFLGWSKDRWTDLRDLSPPGREGEWYGNGPAFADRGVIKFRAGDVKSHHPSAGEADRGEPPQPSKKIAAVLSELQDLPKQAEQEARTVADLQAKNADLQRQLKARPTVADDNAIARAVAAAEQRVRQEANKQLGAASASAGSLKRQLERIMQLVAKIQASGFEGTSVPPEQIEAAVRAAVANVVKIYEGKLTATQNYVEQLQRGVADVADQLAKLTKDGIDVSVDVKHNPPFAIKSTAAPRVTTARAPTPSPSGPGDPSLPKGERAVLIACAQHPNGCDRSQLTTLTGYKRSSRDTYVQRLRERGFLEADGEQLLATAAGVDALGSGYVPLPTGDQLRDHWLAPGRLPEGERKILELLATYHPEAVSRDFITQQTDYKRSSRDTYLQRLSTRKLIVADRDGVRMSDHLAG